MNQLDLQGRHTASDAKVNCATPAAVKVTTFDPMTRNASVRSPTD
jgi:hypothetical protein